MRTRSDITRQEIAVAVFWLHLPVAGYSVVAVLAAASKPISDPADNLPFAIFLIMMFPLNLLACLGVFTNSFAALALIPFNSAIWGWTAGFLWQRIFRP